MTWARNFFQGHFGHFWGPGRVFFQGLGQFSELGGGLFQIGGGFTFSNSRVVLDVQRLIISTDT